MNAISVKNISFCYDSKPIFKDLSLEIRKGSFYSILGPNGSGKTTLLKSIAGLLKPTSGQIVVNGREIDSYSVVERARNISYVPQYQHIVFDVSVHDYVMMGRNPYQKTWEMQGPGDEEIVESVMESCNVSKFRDKSIQSLSGGERQRVMIARAIAQRTPVMLLDEPLSNLDVAHKFEIMDILSELNSRDGVTVIIILHDMSIAKGYSTEALLLKGGKVLCCGKESDVLSCGNIRDCFDLSDSFSISDNGFIFKRKI